MPTLKPISINSLNITPVSMLSKTGDEQQKISYRLNEAFKRQLIGELDAQRDAPLIKIITDLPPVSFAQHTNDTRRKVIERYIAPKVAAAKNEALQQSYEQLLRKIEEVVAIGTYFGLDKPLDTNPIFAEEVFESKTVEQAAISGFSQSEIDKLTADLIPFRNRPEYINWDQLVQSGVVPAAKKEALNLTMQLSGFTGDNLPLVRFLKTQKLAQLGNKNVAAARDLVVLEKKDWEDLIKQAATAPPAGVSAAQYAQNLAAIVESSFPTEYFMHRFAVKGPGDKTAALTKVQALVKDKKIQFVSKNSLLTNYQGLTLSDEEKKAINSSALELHRLSNKYQHLGVKEILNNPDKEPAAKQALIQQKIDLLKKFYQQNTAFDLKQANFFEGYAMTPPAGSDPWKAVPKLEQAGVRKQLMLYQRMQQVSGDTEATEQLLASGYDSAQRIARENPEIFSNRTGLSSTAAARIYQTAQLTQIGTAQALVNAQLAVGYQQGGLTRVEPDYDSLTNTLKKIDGYTDFFGDQNYCRCEHCRSIFSPAAYFVDLMRFVDQQISTKIQPYNHPLKLNMRRPDLWTLPLTCANTNTSVAYLEVINDVLEQYLVKLEAKTNVSKLYEETIAKNGLSFTLPFHLPLYELRTYLAHFGWSLGDLYAKVLPETQGEKVVKEKLGCSDEEYDLLKKHDASQEQVIRDWHGLKPTDDKIDLQRFQSVTGLSRQEVDRLLQVNFIGSGMVIEKETLDIQKSIEYLKKFTTEHLLRTYRFLKLRSKLPWSVAELDLVLKTLGALPGTEKSVFDSPQSLNNAATLQKIALLSDIQVELGIDVDELCGIINDVPTQPLTTDGLSLYDRLFRRDPKLSGIPMLLAGLNISETDYQFLCTNLGINPAAAPMSRLYQICKLSNLLGFSVQEFFALFLEVKYVDKQPEDKQPMTIPQIKKIMDWCRWIKETPFTLEDCLFLLRKREGATDRFTVPSDRLLELMEGIRSEGKVFFKPDALFPALNAEQTKQLADELIQKKLLVPRVGTDKYQLVLPIDLSQTLPLKNTYSPYSEEALRKSMRLYHLREILLDVFSAVFQKEGSVLQWCLKIAEPANWNYGTILGIFTTETKIAQLPPSLIELVQRLEIVLLLKERLQLDTSQLQFIAEHKSLFAIDNLSRFSLQGLQWIALFANLRETEGGLTTALRTALHDNKLDLALPFLSRIWKSDAILLPSILTAFTALLPPNPIARVGYLKACLECCETLGINGASLLALLERTYPAAQTARNVVLGAIQSKYPVAEDFDAIIQPYRDKILARKRDALVDYLLARSRKLGLNFENTNDLYHYFLLDVALEPCAKVSKVLAAISSLQLYVHRVLMNLEQSNDGLNVLEKMTMDREDLENEWEWRKNYRVWEANRKVFVYPENWLEPAFRDNKSPFFKELEEELMQGKMNAEAIEEAYMCYLQKAKDISKLKIVGSYLYDYLSLVNHVDFGGKYMSLILIGRSSEDSRQLYFTQCEYLLNEKPIYESQWRPWQKLDISIDADIITPIFYKNRLYIFWTEIKTTSLNAFENGNSKFKGYKHKVYLNYSYYKIDKKWAPPIKFKLCEISDLCTNGIPQYDEKRMVHLEAAEDYTLNSDKFGRIYIFLDRFNDLCFYYYPEFNYKEDSNNDYIYLYKLMINGERLVISKIDYGSWVPVKDINIVNNKVYGQSNQIYELNTKARYYQFHYDYYISNINERNPDVIFTCINNSIGDTDIKINIINRDKSSFDSIGSTYVAMGSHFLIKYGDKDVLLIRRKIWGGWEGISLFSNSLNDIYESALTANTKKILSIEAQKHNKDIGNLYRSETWSPSGIDKFRMIIDKSNLDFKGPFGSYYWELFFHIPHAIANHLNANQQFKESQSWYHYMFNPTAPKDTYCAKEVDRNWQFLPFRKGNTDKLDDILTDFAQIRCYREAPFNPHAIARLRNGAYPKAIIMKYIDNLLDWGDQLFAQDTFESLNEATLLYILASDILGPQPVEMGKCELSQESQVTYQRIQSTVDAASSEFLVNMENQFWNIRTGKQTQVEGLSNATSGVLQRYMETAQLGQATVTAAKAKKDVASVFADSYTAVLPVFCVPSNDTLLGYWDRVGDRLFKIRNCMNIKGVRREMAFFQPPIDPGLLVRAKAAGLSLADALALGGNVSPYRFTYLLEKARNYASTVQQFGSALLSALERRDNEELSLLRSVHEQNILKLTRDIKKKNIAEAARQLEALKTSKASLEYRRDHYKGLIEKGLIGSERTEQSARQLATGFSIMEGVYRMVASLTYLIPQMGSPFAMKYGGKEMGDSFSQLSNFYGSLSLIANSISASAGLEASFQRRADDWRFQEKSADNELRQIDKQILAAEIRLAIAEKDLDIHEKNLEQGKELYDFYKDKFTNLGLYSYYATTLTRLYREAYQQAFTMAQQAENAYRFERDDPEFYIQLDNWNTERAGLLSGERLLLQLQRLEQTYLANHERDYEVAQSFSMLQWSPEELIKLKSDGSCTFIIPEIAFDLFYPGQYRRKIKSVSISIPCVTGPYVNVPCKVTLLSGVIRVEPKAGKDSEEDSKHIISEQYSTSIATSSALNDSGMFELNFRDERYLPFEGAGAVNSQWQLELPAKIRPFDYNTIPDVIFHVNYTAKDDGGFRDAVNIQIEKGLQQATESWVQHKKLLFRLISLRQEFPEQYYQLKDGGKAAVTIRVGNRHFPVFVSEYTIIPTGINAVKPTGQGGLDKRDLVFGKAKDEQHKVLVNTWDVTIKSDNLFKEDVLVLVEYTIG